MIPSLNVFDMDTATSPPRFTQLDDHFAHYGRQSCLPDVVVVAYL
jgi:hypothetical protein